MYDKLNKRTIETNMLYNPSELDNRMKFLIKKHREVEKMLLKDALKKRERRLKLP